MDGASSALSAVDLVGASSGFCLSALSAFPLCNLILCWRLREDRRGLV